LLNEDIASAPSGGGGNSGGGPTGNITPGGGFQLQITTQDKEAIDRVRDFIPSNA